MQATYESSISCLNGKLLSLTKKSLKMLIVAPGLKRLKKTFHVP
jgi:hypothetical protein